MIKEALEFMNDLGVKNASRIVKAEAEPGHIYYLRGIDGSLTKTVADIAPRNNNAADLSAIVSKAAEAAEADEPAEIWYSRSGVVLFIGAARRDVVKLDLGLSVPLTVLSQWENNKPTMQQASLIKELRITFRDCLSPAGNIIEVLRRVKFNAAQASDSVVQHGKVSLGKQLTAEVTGTGTLPEYLTFMVPVFNNPTLASAQAGVECALEPDAPTTTFQVIPIPGQISKAIAAGETRLGSLLAEGLSEAGAEKVGLYFGQP